MTRGCLLLLPGSVHRARGEGHAQAYAHGYGRRGLDTERLLANLRQNGRHLDLFLWF